MKANHNRTWCKTTAISVVASTTKIQKWKQITTQLCRVTPRPWLLPVRQRYKNESKSQPSWRTRPRYVRCCQYDKDTKMKANHNPNCPWRRLRWLLPVRQRYKNESKSQRMLNIRLTPICCCQYDKDTKMKANHNFYPCPCCPWGVVASTTKIQKWKQITTNIARHQRVIGCCQYDKDTKMKANHNWPCGFVTDGQVVASTTKIQKWKQITTQGSCIFLPFMLLPVRQRYKNESKSQPASLFVLSCFCCCQYDKDTKMKANHNQCTGVRRC